jgi:hypothetical protein
MKCTMSAIALSSHTNPPKESPIRTFVRDAKRVLLCRWRGDIRLAGIVQGKLPATPRRPAQVIDRQVVQDGEQPCARVAVGAPLMPAADRPFQRVLDQVVGGACGMTISWPRSDSCPTTNAASCCLFPLRT